MYFLSVRIITHVEGHLPLPPSKPVLCYITAALSTPPAVNDSC